MIWLAAGAGGGLLVGAFAGWLIGRRKPNGDTRDWKTRIAARDRDLHAAEEARSEAAAELERVRTELRESKVQLVEAETKTAELETGRVDDGDLFPIPPDTPPADPADTTPAPPLADVTDLLAQVDTLERELAKAEDELMALRAGSDDGAGGADGKGDARTRIDELESGLATLESLRCPDPTVHQSAEEPD